MHGRVASILEVGTGFHPDLTGRENIFFCGTMLGIEKNTLKEREAEIIDFSGIEEFIDTPVKHYSSGMYLRLAVAITFHVDADILLLDEILSVGDAEFRLKTLKKMAAGTDSGTTILMVSHNLNEILQLCNKCIVLDHGKVVEFGNPTENVRHYLDRVIEEAEKSPAEQAEKKADEEEGSIKKWADKESAPGNDIIRLKQVLAKAKGKHVKDKIFMEDALVVEVEYWKLKQGLSIELLILFFDRMGNPLFNSAIIWNNSGQKVYSLFSEEEGLFRIACELPAGLLHKGGYSLQLRFGKNTTISSTEQLYVHNEHFNFAVHRNPDSQMETCLDEISAPLHPVCNWKQEKISE